MGIIEFFLVHFSVLEAVLCFNIDPAAWRYLSNNAEGFGHQVVQRTSDLLVSAPLAQSSNSRGEIYKCTTTSCSKLTVPMPAFAVNASLGLTMTSDPTTQKTLACAPTIPKDCKSITMYNGICWEISNSDQVGPHMPPSLEECRYEADIAFLLDGSGSLSDADFRKMKDFVNSLVRSFKGAAGTGSKFAIAQFSTGYTTEYDFNTFNTNNYEGQINQIRQQRGWTYTASAIQQIVNNVFSPAGGSRSNVKQVLIVITDGESNDRDNLQSSADSAERKKIVRFAIGVGGAFNKPGARQELNTIASHPAEDHVFKVDNFEALDKIRENLQDKIFSIEGSKQGGEALKMEMSQGGFSAAYVPGSGGIQMAVVGANQWKGGFQLYQGQQKISSYLPEDMEPDSYLGYSMAVGRTSRGPLTVLGAPRYQHRGVVITVLSGRKYKTIDPSQWQSALVAQSGEYFGAEVCAMDVSRNGYTDLILISAPMYKDADREGRVHVCSLVHSTVDCHLFSPVVLRGDASDKGRFGSSLAVLPDINTDGFNDLAVGAPLENDGQGSIYIFHGEGGGRISRTYSQRIAASEVMPGLRFFGMSISKSSADLSGDSLPDLAVGSKGRVVLLRSRPIVMVYATVSFKPNLIPTQNTDCNTPLKNEAEICFTMTRKSGVDGAQGKINFTLTLDANRKAPNNRAFLRNKQQKETKSIDVDLQGKRCTTVEFQVESCPEDALNPLSNELKFTFDGVPSSTKLRPSLAEQAQTTSRHLLGFEINCGADEKCIDNLKVDFNFTQSSEVKVGIDELLDVTVSVENSEENSYNSHVILTYPAGLSFRKFVGLQGRIECNSLDSEDLISRGQTACSIDKPIFKSNTKAFFIVSYGIDSNSQFQRKIFITANATSGNQEHSSTSKLFEKKWINVKYSIFATFESSLSYNNFTFGVNDLQKPVHQSVVVTNDIRELNFTVVIKMPVKLGDKDIWVDSSSLQIPTCEKHGDEEPKVTDFVAQIKKNKLVDCSVARCRVFKCREFMGKLDSKTYKISANLSSGWIEQIGLQAAKFLLTSTATMEYNRDQYIFFSAGSNNNPPVRKIETEVEVYAEPNFIKEIIGGSLGGLALLALITAGLYKAGFFKSKYQEMINEAGQAGDPGVDGGEPAGDLA